MVPYSDATVGNNLKVMPFCLLALIKQILFVRIIVNVIKDSSKSILSINKTRSCYCFTILLMVLPGAIFYSIMAYFHVGWLSLLLFINERSIFYAE